MNSGQPDARAGTPPAASPLRLFASVDMRSLALFRIALGLVLTVDLLARLRLVDTLFSNDGVLTNHFSLFRPLAPLQFSLYVAASSTRDVTVVFWLTLVVYVLFTIGYRTRLFQVLSFILVTSLHSRNLLAELPSDVPIHLFLAWSLVLPLGARFSVDSVRRSLKRVEERSPEELNLRTAPPRTFVSIAVAGLILQLAVIHLFSALRQNGSTWSDGSALYYALHQNLWVSNAGSWLAEHASVDVIRKLSFAYRGLEFAIAALVLVPIVYVRRAALAVLVLFHLASAVLWSMGPYDWVFLAVAPVLLTSHDWDLLVGWYGRRKRTLTVYFDGDCGICLALSRLLKRLDSLGRITFALGASDQAPDAVKAVAAETVAVRDEKSGTVFTKSRAVATALGALPLGKPFEWFLRLPGISSLADRAYELVSKHRAAISVWFGYDACGVPHSEAPAAPPPDEPIPELERTRTSLRESAALIFLVVCAYALAQGMNDETRPRGFEAAVYSIVAYPRLYQDWKLFAPDPPKRQGALVVEAQTGKGAKIDPLTGRAPLETLDPFKPDPRSRLAPLMSAYFANINRSDRVIYVDELKNYVQRLSDQRDANDKLVWFNVNWLEAPIPPPDGATPEMAGIVPSRRLTSRP